MKRLLLLSAVLIALLAVAWAAGMFEGPASTFDLPDLGLNSGDVTRVEVRNANEHVSAHRLDSGEWELEEPLLAKADTATVMRLIRQVEEIDLENIVSSNPDKFGLFQVDDTGKRLIVDRGESRLDLIVGKMGPDFQSSYVRIDGDDRVMLANGLPPLTATLDQWRDKTLWVAPASAVTGVLVTNEDGSYGLVKTDGGWSLQSGTESLVPDSAQVADLVGRLSSLKADGFQSGLTVDSVLTGVTHQVQIEFANGSAETLLMSKRKSDVAAIREGSGDIYKLFSHRLTNLTPDIEKLIVAGGPTARP